MPQNWKNILLEFFRKELPASTKVYLFGSRARGDAKSASDIDIGFLNLPKKPSIGDLEEKIENLNIVYTIDLVDLSKVGKDFYKQAMSEAIELR